ncbi:polysaccharide deacetylase family protein [Chloroflexales bacterium ZM16-3]|nr:polysaccharide deacetylase family protein [Chloroflexales bacterium ZM16-3]
MTGTSPIVRPRSLPGRILWRIERELMGTVIGVRTAAPLVALTFDDGPHPTFTPRLLDLLGRYDARATFFMLGQSAAARPDLVRQVAEAGHTVANHTWSHARMPEVRGRQRRAEIRRCAQALKPYGVRLFRPPFGGQSLASRLDAFLLGHQVVTWSAHAEDWRVADPAVVADRVERALQPGAIILLHDALAGARPGSLEDRGAMIAGLELLFDRLDRRYQFVTLPELMRQGRPVRVSWYREAL